MKAGNAATDENGVVVRGIRELFEEEGVQRSVSFYEVRKRESERTS